MNFVPPRLRLVKDYDQQQEVTTIEKEPIRDWSFGFITGHRLRVVIYLILAMGVLYGLQSFIWPQNRQPHALWEQMWSWGSILWLAALLPGTIGLLGMLVYRYPSTLDQVQPTQRIVVWRIVSYGKNVEVLMETIRRCKEEMAKTPLFTYLIEVVVDEVPGRPKFQLLDPFSEVRFIWVPANYTTPNRSRFKARALHYAMEHSMVPDTAWVVFLDEETQPTSSGIKGICRMIHEEELSQKLRVGQGAILYHRLWKKHPFLTLADMARTGDDFARFFFQHQVGITLFGLHGSFIVARTDVIKKSGGFDFGPNGDITEDAFWALVVMSLGVRSRWIEGYLEEQSTHSVKDFVKQRCRWLQGLIKVVLYAPVKLRWRLFLGVNTLLWVVASFSTIYTICNFMYGFESQAWIQFLANYSFSTFVILYLVGLTTNMDEHGIRNRYARAALTILQLLLLPVFTVMESLGVIWGLATPTSGFHVVQK